VLRNYQTEILSIANSKYSDKYIFGGSDSSSIPFKLESGVLTYHGVDVDSSSGFTDETVYYDIGLGLQTDVSGEVIEGTAFNISNPGSKIFGTGTDTDGITNNLYNLLGELADKFDANDMEDIDKYVTKLDSLVDKNMVNYVDVGQKTNFIEFLSSRFDTSEVNLTEKQKNIEGIDSAKAILEYKAQETAYNAALQMGSNIIQMTLLNYMT
jgi:flagellar hook-associated protein 3 FlgL